MKYLLFSILLLSSLVSFAQDVSVDKISYELSDLRGEAKKYLDDTIISKGKVEIYTLKNNSDKDYIIFISRNGVDRPLEKKIGHYYYGPTPGSGGLPLHEIVWSANTRENGKEWFSWIYMNFFIKRIKPDESFRIVCTYNPDYSGDSFERRITICTQEEFSKVIGKTDFNMLCALGFFYPYDTFGVIL